MLAALSHGDKASLLIDSLLYFGHAGPQIDYL